MVDSNVPHFRSLASVSCIEIILQVKIVILSSVQSNKHMMARSVVSVVRTERLQTRSFQWNPAATCINYGKIVQLQSALNHDYNNFSGKIKHVPHFRAHIGRFFPNLVLVSSLWSIFIDSFNSAKKRCNTSQGFRASFGQWCDRDQFLFPFISWSYSLFFSLS